MKYLKKIDISYFRIFGARAFVHLPDAIRKKFDPKSQGDIFVGYFETSKAFRVWIPDKQKIVISRDVLIDKITISNIHLLKVNTFLFFQIQTVKL